MPRLRGALRQRRRPWRGSSSSCTAPSSGRADEHEKLGIGAMILKHAGSTPAPGTPDPDGVHFTADFIATDDGMLFLEGGPPHFMRAHPCRFDPGGRYGIALSAERHERRHRRVAGQQQEETAARTGREC